MMICILLTKQSPNFAMETGHTLKFCAITIIRKVRRVDDLIRIHNCIKR